MIVLGARFRALAGARAALRAIRTSIGVASGDVAVRPLGGTSYEAPVDDFLLAGRFEDGDVPAVINVMHAHGGRVIERRRDTPSRPPAREAESGLERRLRRPPPRLRARTALRHRIGADRQ